MANIDSFPQWKPQSSALRKIDNPTFRRVYLRNAASNFIKREDVRLFIFKHKGKKCYLCGSEATQIDHRISAYRFAAYSDLDYMQMNSYENLFPICRKCNASKAP